MVYVNQQGKVIVNSDGKAIENVNADIYKPEPLPVTKQQFVMKNKSICDVYTTPHIKIRDASGNSWTIEDWHADASARGFETSGVPRPVGLDIRAWGRHFVYYFNNKYNEPAGAAKTYYDITGTTAVTNGGLRHSQWQHTMDTFAAGADSQGNPITRTYNGVTATSTLDGDDVILSTSNSPFTWRIKKDIKTRYAFLGNNAKDIFDALLAYTEWYRVLAAKDLGIVTDQQISDWHLLDEQSNSRFIDIKVLNSAGTARPAENEDMYFHIYNYTTSSYDNLNIVSPSLLAKYNSHSVLGGENLTSTIADDIYTKQQEHGVNMNDDASNAISRTGTIGGIILTEGCKGAQVYVHNVNTSGTITKHLFLVTPVISRANNGLTQIISPDYNIPDAPALSWVKKCGEDNNIDMFLPDEQMLEAVWDNRNSSINSIITYLNKTSGIGENWGIRSFPSDTWSVVRFSANTAWIVYFGNGYVNASSTYLRFAAPCVSALN